MKGFRDTSKTMAGHQNSPMYRSTGGTINRLAGGGHFGSMPGVTGGPNKIGGLDEHRSDMNGHAAVHREEAGTQELAEHGGKTPLTPGYAEGGKTEKHFHVHKHYHEGGKTKTKSKSYRGLEKEAEMATGGTINKMKTGGTMNKMKKGGMHINLKHKGKFTKKMTGSKKGHLTGSDVQRGLHSKSAETRKEANFARMARRHFEPLAEGGHIHDDTTPHSPDFATGGTINKVCEGGPMKATGGTINRLGAGGALYRGGGQMKRHLNTQAPKGHKGMGEFVRRGGR
jgi:hypothetical protein